MPSESEIVECKLISKTRKGTSVRSDAVLEYAEGRIFFLKSAFALKGEIKAMKGSKWHGFDEDEPRKIWSVEDCQRNRFQIAYLAGEQVYEWFDRDLVEHTMPDLYLSGKLTPPMAHQVHMANCGLTYHYQIWGAEMGVGKTLSAMIVIMLSGVKKWWWVGPKTSLPNIRREFKKWGFDAEARGIEIVFMTYDSLVTRMDEFEEGHDFPQGVIFDESSRLKGATSQRTKAAQMLGDMIREHYRLDGYLIEMSGTPSPKTPMDWWPQCEIAWPGFLKEGSVKALEQRCAFMSIQQYEGGNQFNKRTGWKDDPLKCDVCGDYLQTGAHTLPKGSKTEDWFDQEDEGPRHDFVSSVNEVALMYERLAGLVVIKHKKDCLTLPDKRYRKIVCRPSSSVLRLAQVLKDSAANTMTGATLLRELSDGFQYKDKKDGTMPCGHCPEHSGKVFEWFRENQPAAGFQDISLFDKEEADGLVRREVDCPKCKGTGRMTKWTRETKVIPCPKQKALEQLLEECEEVGRIVVFAGFTGSVDRCVDICQKSGWAVVRCDGRGFQVTDKDGTVLIHSDGDDALEYWSNMTNVRVAFVAHPESGGMSLTLTEARMAVYWSNSFKPEYRTQSEDRIHRKGMDENLGCQIVDLIHLPSDQRVLEVIRDNRRIELLTMGEVFDVLDNAECDDGSGILIEELVS